MAAYSCSQTEEMFPFLADVSGCIDDMSMFHFCNATSIKSEPIAFSDYYLNGRMSSDLGDSFESEDDRLTSSGKENSDQVFQDTPSPLASSTGDSRPDISTPSSGVAESRQDFISSTLLLSDQDEGEFGIGEKRLCLVCGDTSSGYHYGVSSCEACKAFFKRSIQGNIEYICPGNGNCEITKRRRKSCQACRFQKCLASGMLREGVRLDRVRGGRQKYKRMSTSSVSSVESPPPLPKKSYIDDNPMLKAMLNIEAEPLRAFPDSQPLDELKFMSVVSDLADRELVATIGWAKEVEGFGDLHLSDQMALLQASWLDILCLSMCYRSKPYRGKLVFAYDFNLTEEEVLEAGTTQEVVNVSSKLAKKITDAEMTREEFVLLKGLILMNTDVVVDNKETVKTIHDKLHDSLLLYTNSNHGGNPRRVGDLLMILPVLTQLKILARGYWFDVKKDGRVPMHQLFLEMLEANV